MGRSTVYNANLVTEEKWARVNKQNKELLEEWVEYLQSADRSRDTIEQYIADLKICFCWLLENADNKFFLNINKRDIIKYQNWMLNTLKLSSSRIRRLKASISSLSNYIVNVLDDVYPDFRNIINKIPAPANEPVREKTILEDDEVSTVLKNLLEEGKIQMACVVALAAFSGSRKSELLRFKKSFFKDEYIVNGLYKTPEKIKTKGRGAGGKKLNKFVIANDFKPFLEAWLEERKRLGVPEEMDELFVISKSGEWFPMQVSTLDNWTEQLSERFGKFYYFHSMRHFFCTALYKAGIPAEIIKQVIGWSSVSMVSIYTDISAEDELDKYFNSDGVIQQEKK